MSLSFFSLISIVCLFAFQSLDLLNGHPCGLPGYFEHDQQLTENANDTFYFCSNSGVLLGNEARTCQSDGHWSGDIPSCVFAEKDFIHRANHSSIHQHQRGDVDIASCLSDNNVQGSCIYMSGGDKEKRINILFRRAYKVTAVRVILHPEEYYKTTTVDIYKTNNLDSNYTKCFRERRDKQLYRCPGAELGWLMVIRFNVNLDLWLSVREVYIYEEPMPDLSKNCPIPDSPEYGHFGMSDHGQVVRYVCDENYVLLGDNQTDCLLNGSWSQQAPVCQASVVCDTLAIDNGIWVINQTSQVASLECSNGFEIQGGPTTIRCMGMEGWSETNASCFIEDQTTLTSLIHSTVHHADMMNGLVEPNETVTEQNDTTISSTQEDRNDKKLGLLTNFIIVGTMSGLISSLLVLAFVLCFLFGFKRYRSGRSNDDVHNQHRRESSYYHYYNGINYDDMREAERSTSTWVSLSERPPAKDPRVLPDILDLVYEIPGRYNQSTSRYASTVETELSEPSEHIYSQLDDGQIYDEPANLRLSSSVSLDSEVFDDNEIYEAENQ